MRSRGFQLVLSRGNEPKTADVVWLNIQLLGFITQAVFSSWGGCAGMIELVSKLVLGVVFCVWCGLVLLLVYRRKYR